jgi:hypothetical protein
MLLGCLLIFVSGAMRNSGTPGGVPASTDCALRKLALEYGRSLAPARGDFRSLFDALQLQECGVETPKTRDEWTPPNYTAHSNSDASIYVDANTGSDTTGDGSKDRPLLSIEAALVAARSLHSPQKTILLRAGTFYLAKALKVLPGDSNLTIQNFNGERAVVSGGVAFKPVFKPVSTAPQLAFSPLPSSSSLSSPSVSSSSLSPPPPPPPVSSSRWQVYNNTNNVFQRARSKRDSGVVKYIGLFDSAAACGDALASNLSFHSWAWQPVSAGNYAKQVRGQPVML